MQTQTQPQTQSEQNSATMFPRMHVSIYVRDLARSVAFYERWWAQKPEKVKPGYAKFHLEQPGLVFSMVENPARANGNFGHVGIQVATPDDLETWKSAARDAGLAMKVEDEVSCCYSVQDKFWVADPDGVQWEVYYFHADAEFNDPTYSPEQGSNANASSSAACSTGFSLEDLPSGKPTSAANPQACEPGSGCC